MCGVAVRVLKSNLCGCWFESQAAGHFMLESWKLLADARWLTQCSMHWFPPPVKTTHHNMTLGIEQHVKIPNNSNFRNHFLLSPHISLFLTSRTTSNGKIILLLSFHNTVSFSQSVSIVPESVTVMLRCLREPLTTSFSAHPSWAQHHLVGNSW